MQILLYNVTTALKIGGVETFYYSVAKELMKDHKVTICTGRGKFVPAFLKESNIDLKMFNFCPREKVLKLGNRFRKFIERVSFYFNARKFLKSQKFDVLVIHKPFDFFVAYLLKKHDKNLKTIFVSGGEDFYFFDRFFVKFIDKIISVSDANADILRKRYDREIKVVYNGVDKEKFYPDASLKEKIREKFDVKSDEILIGSVGRVVGWKGFGMMVKNIDKIKNAKFMLVGDGENLQSLRELATKLNVSQKVIFIGAIRHDELNQYYNACDIYLQPSIGHEAFGITVIEALSANKPCVVSINGGMKEIIKDGVNGYKFKISDESDMIEKINLTLENIENLRPRESIKDMYEWSKFAQELVEL
ncbi:glycosyltransferase family 4 protein [Campylobacter concisus]|uniref:glycosyltransferase family 4 protein n=1 Tax=Campylobacter concisus TaxID=199 RepID=UPI0009FD4A65|nr:glycosyltransferase family 4 protein [Campylobacter concisus]ORI04537.1 hypothetical protein A3223_03245 [Campylobacter concisus]